MKKIKKILAAIMTLAMVLGMSMTTLAAGESATITVDGAEGATVQYVKIITEDRESPIGWKFVNNSYASAFIPTFGANADAVLTALTELQGNGNGNAQNGVINSNTDLGNALKTLMTQITSWETYDAAQKPTTTEAGLYLIRANQTGYTYSPMLAYIGFDEDGGLVDATVTAKGAENDVSKDITADGDKSVSAGDTVHYEVTVEYPYYSGTNVEYKITDTLTNGTYNEGSVAVTVGSTNLVTAGKCDVDITNAADPVGATSTSTLVIDLGGLYYDSSLAGQTVTITYNVTVGNGTEGMSNEVTTTTDTTGSDVTVDMVSVDVIKYSENKEDPLEGAIFTLYVEVPADTEGAEHVTNATVVGGNGAGTGKDLWLAEVAVSAATGTDGKVTFEGLDAQKTYYVQETQAPQGYKVDDSYYKLGGSTETTSEGSTHYTFTNFTDVEVVDTNLSALPSTGGIGTTIFTIGGCIIMIAAAGLFFASRRKSSK